MVNFSRSPYEYLNKKDDFLLMRRGVGVGVHLCLGDTPMILEEGIGSAGAVWLGYTELQDT